MLLEASFNLLGVLAALNRVYYARFELKRLRALVAKFEYAPPHLADRLEAPLPPACGGGSGRARPPRRRDARPRRAGAPRPRAAAPALPAPAAALVARADLPQRRQRPRAGPRPHAPRRDHLVTRVPVWTSRTTAAADPGSPVCRHTLDVRSAAGAGPAGRSSKLPGEYRAARGGDCRPPGDDRHLVEPSSAGLTPPSCGRRAGTGLRQHRQRPPTWRQMNSSPCSSGRPCGPPGTKRTRVLPTDVGADAHQSSTLGEGLPSRPARRPSGAAPRAEAVALVEQLVDPVARRMQLEAVARVRRDEVRLPPCSCTRSSASSARASVRSNSSSSRARPRWSTRGIAHWPGCTTTFTAPCSSSHSRSLKPISSSSVHEMPGLVRRQVLADPPVARDQVEAELADVARLDLAHPARDEVVVEEVHGADGREDSRCRAKARWIRWESITSTSSSRPSSAACRLPRAARAARLARDQRGRGRARRDDLVPERSRDVDRPARVEERAAARSTATASASPPRNRGGLARSRRRAGRVAPPKRGAARERAAGIHLHAGVLRSVLRRPDGSKLEILHVPAHAA